MTDSAPWGSVLANFTRNAAHFNRVGPPFYSTFAERLLDLLDPSIGATGLDVCCGTGAVTLPLARRLGQSGRAIGVDLTPAMLERAVAESESARLENVEFREGDATRLDLPPASFDVVTCGFGIQFMPEPEAAVAHWAGFVKPGGRLGCSTWSEGGFEPMMTLARELLSEYGITSDPWHRRPTAKPDSLIGFARAAGLGEVECVEERRSIVFANAADAVHGTPRGRNVLNLIPAEQRDAVRDELISRLTAVSGTDGLALEMGVLYLTARQAS
ncbi:MAG TPA: methyltransferase domain-containing protein [Chloroflexota bacterium]|nr:methyltransferase domain-containing protein [Chloroflexota bacterium]